MGGVPGQAARVMGADYFEGDSPPPEALQRDLVALHDAPGGSSNASQINRPRRRGRFPRRRPRRRRESAGAPLLLGTPVEQERPPQLEETLLPGALGAQFPQVAAGRRRTGKQLLLKAPLQQRHARRPLQNRATATSAGRHFVALVHVREWKE